MSLSFYSTGMLGVQKAVFCGEGGPMQVNIQKDLAGTIQLLEAPAEGEPGHDPDLVALAADVNRYFEQRAVKLLHGRRRQLAGDGVELADRLEVTLLITANGLELAYDVARPRKQIAPAPRKPLLRRILGPLWPYPTWEMPAGRTVETSSERAGTDGRTKTARKPAVRRT